ncbi:MAG TPA: glycoside hydrolase family 9 protein [Anaeromyxobacter sp.]|nr:glycoside hydrolase family 9 protein [Anaeromyxobacter sp.]
MTRAQRRSHVGLFTLALLLAAGAMPAAAAEFVVNGTFDDGSTAPWWNANANTTASVVDGRMCVAVASGTVNPWDAIVGQNGVALEQGKSYTFSFVASADAPVTIRAIVQLPDAPYTATFSQPVQLGATPAAYSFEFTNTLPTGALGVQFQVGGASATGFTFCVDEVSISDGAAPAGERIVNGTFDGGTTDPWWQSNAPFSVVNGRMCAAVPPATANPWDAIVGQNGLELVQGQQYALSFSASADAAVTIRALVQLTAAPYSSTLSEPVALGPTPQTYRYTFTNNLPTGALGLQFQMGGASPAGFTVCFDDVSLTGSTGPGYVPDTGPALRVNQVGYVTYGPKRANLVTDATAPLTWELVDAAGAVVTSGLTTVYGADAASGDKVHLIDFSRVHRSGDGFTLRVGDVVSYPFSVDGDVYDGLRRDAVAFFYHQRSGTPIEAQYVGDLWARPAGHLGVAPNQGDTWVFCVPGVCDYALDVRGGWYDAGDQGKYVVNGGIAVWQLVNTWERAYLHRGALRDGTQKIPERANRVPDILDEARWELEFLLRMQVPEGLPYAGMAQHKVHDDAWTGIPTRPDLDAQPRHLRGVSTAATLNLAATAAQCARVWRGIDGAFAKRCLVAAERAYAAAAANPAVSCAPGGGGGDYGDSNLTDEFYWAAAELFVTTGKSAYKQAVQTSPVYLAKGIPENGYSWGSVAALGDFTLALVPNKLPLQDQLALRKAIAALADQRIATMKAQGYPVPVTTGGYYWGSNSQVLNQITILAVAFDLTFDLKYRQAAFEAMDYILGRNALNISYVTGYGTKYAENQHHRFWAHQANQAYPNPPPGSLAGGANHDLQDPIAASKLKGCAPAKCYIDHFESYATNEVAINWNSALAWVAAWLADHAGP